MSVTQDKNGKFLVHVDRKGMPRVRKSFSTQADAEQFERDYIISAKANWKVGPAVTPAFTDERTIKDLSLLWFKYHGINLSDGVRRHQCLDRIADALGNPIACALTPEMFLNYRFNRLQAGRSPKTVNNEHKYLSALYSKLIRLGIINCVNQVAKVDIIRVHERQLSYLSHQQIDELFNSLSLCKNQSVWYVAQLCLRTGARWGEAEKLCFKQLRDGRVTYEFTKSKKTRTIPLNAVFYSQLIKFAEGKNPNDRIFSECYASFRRCFKKSGIVVLPAGQCSHILRHSFASHFVMNGGHILSLQKILGHSDIDMTMRYAHLAPEHFQDAVKFNPFSQADSEKS
ncbi:MAG: tyrosine-type recombinase/integrase [Methylovulum sp.]|nr:tyrosine-type recombinase/integrase [Methylovulum sp.]